MLCWDIASVGIIQLNIHDNTAKTEATSRLTNIHKQSKVEIIDNFCCRTVDWCCIYLFEFKLFLFSSPSILVTATGAERSLSQHDHV